MIGAIFVEFSQLILIKIIKIVANRSDFKAKTHQIQFRLGLPQTLLGKLIALSQTLS